MPSRYGADFETLRIDAPNPLETPPPLRTIGPVRAVTTPLGDIVAAPFSVGADTGCTNAALRVTGGGHFTGRVGIGVCPGSSNAGLQITGPGNSTLRMVSTSSGPVLYITPFSDTEEALRISNAADLATRHRFFGDGNVELAQGGTGKVVIGNGSAPVLDAGANGLSIRAGSNIPLALRTSSWLLVADHDSADREFRIDNTTGALRLHHGTAATVGTADIAFEGGGLGAYWAPDAAGRLTLGTVSLPWGNIHAGTTWSLYSGATKRASIFSSTVDTLSFGSSTDVERWKINASGHLIGGADNTYDIGASGATRPRTGYFATSLISPALQAPAATNLDFGGAATSTWRVSTAGHLLAITDNANDIGASGATRPRNVYVAEGVGLRHVNVSAVGTGIATVETDLMTHTLPTLVTGDTIEIMASGTVSGLNNNKTVKLLVAGATLATTGTIAAGTTGTWFFWAKITRDGANLHSTVITVTNTLGALTFDTQHSVAVDPSGAVAKCTGITVNASDEVTQERMVIIIHKA